MPPSPEHSASNLSSSGAAASPPPYILHPPPLDDTAVADLIDSECQTMPRGDYLHRCRHRSINVIARQDSINWMLKVHAHYRFAPATALLSVNYFDRFLSTNSLPERKSRWPFQLLSVACLSLAAKMEEPDMLPLLHLQILNAEFVFQPKTVQRMELLVMSNLLWRLRSTTPFDYLHFFISKLPSSSSRLFATSSALILRTIRVIDFLGYAPSTIAAAAVICAAGESELSAAELFHERLSNERVRSCHQVMEEYLVDACPSAGLKAADFEAVAPSSPVGVLDTALCDSCDTRSENPESSSGS